MNRNHKLPKVNYISFVCHRPFFQHIEVNLPNFVNTFVNACVAYANEVLHNLREEPEYRLDGEDIETIVHAMHKCVFDALYIIADDVGLPEQLVVDKAIVLQEGLFAMCYVTPSEEKLNIVLGCTKLETAVHMELRQSFLVQPDYMSLHN